MRQAIMVEGAARPGGGYSHAVLANGFIFVAGQGPAHPVTGVIPDAFADQVRQTLDNLRLVLRGTGVDLADVVKVNTYLSDLTRFAEYDAIYREFFPAEPPARTTIGCQLKAIQVEIDCIAVAPTDNPRPVTAR
jgi:2-iminobutanoate/2-iminopropanoate deaminase